MRAPKPAMWRDKLKFELVGCGLMLLAFVIASGVGFFAVLLSGSAELAAAVMVVSFIAVCWAGDRLWGLRLRLRKCPQRSRRQGGYSKQSAPFDGCQVVPQRTCRNKRAALGRQGRTALGARVYVEIRSPRTAYRSDPTCS